MFLDRGWWRRKGSDIEHLGSGKGSYLALRGQRIRTRPLQQTMGTSSSSDWIRNFKMCHKCILLCVAIFCKPWNGCFKSGHMCGKCKNYSFPLLPPALTLRGKGWGYGKEFLNVASGAPGLSPRVLVFLSIFPTQQVLVATRCSPDTREAVMLQTARGSWVKTTVYVIVIGREGSGGSALGKKQVLVCGRSAVQSATRVPGGGLWPSNSVPLCSGLPGLTAWSW